MLRTRLRHAGTLLVLVGIAIAFRPGDNRRPEVLVSEDGRLVAILRDSGVATNRARPPDFVYAQWRRALRLGEVVKPTMRKTAGLTVDAEDVADETTKNRKSPRHKANREKAKAAMLSALDAAAKQAGFICETKAFCVAVSPNEWRIVTLEDVAFLGTACDLADLVVTQVPLRIAACRSGAKLITARHLRRTGALEILPGEEENAPFIFEASITPAVETLDRPWSRHRTYDWRTGTYTSGNAEGDRAHSGTQGGFIDIEATSPSDF